MTSAAPPPPLDATPEELTAARQNCADRATARGDDARASSYLLGRKMLVGPWSMRSGKSGRRGGRGDSVAWIKNPGSNTPPPETEIWAEQDGERVLTGYRSVHVRLRNGHDTKARGQDPWRAKTTDWTFYRSRRGEPWPFDVLEFEVA